MIIFPHGIIQDSGVSFYGVMKATEVPYLTALLGGALFMLLTSIGMPRSVSWPYRWGLIWFALMVTLVAIFPYNTNTLYHVLHNTFGSLLFISQLTLTSWYVLYRSDKSKVVIAAWMIQLLAGAYSAYYLVDINGYLFISQVVFQIAFSILFTHRLITLPAATPSLSES